MWEASMCFLFSFKPKRAGRAIQPGTFGDIQSGAVVFQTQTGRPSHSAKRAEKPWYPPTHSVSNPNGQAEPFSQLPSYYSMRGRKRQAFPRASLQMCFFDAKTRAEID